MSAEIDSLIQKRNLLLTEMQAIDRLRRGSLSRQFFKAPPGRKERRGPYFVLQGFFQGKKFSERIPAEQAPQVQQHVDNYRRFQTLAQQFVTLTDAITRLDSSRTQSKKNSSRRN